jgi:hypothetical protein
MFHQLRYVAGIVVAVSLAGGLLAAERPGDFLDVTLLSHRQAMLLTADGTLQQCKLLDP